MSASPSTFKPRRGRPNAKQVLAIEQTILAAARSLFLEEGFDAVTMERVAGLAGVSKGTLYARYPGKADLFIAIVEASVLEWTERTSQALDTPSHDIRERLRHHAGAIAESLLFPDVLAFQRAMLANADRFPELSRAMHDVGYRYIVRLIAVDIERAAIQDGIPVNDAESIGSILVSSITGWQMQERAHHEISHDELHRFAKRTADLLLAARASW
jgi:AcrR family transcriptional regulator